MMRTVLFFISSTRHSCKQRLDGIYRYANAHGWHVQVVERAFHKVDVRASLDFFRPIGVIAECGSGADELTPNAFGDLPVVYFDAEPGVRQRYCVGMNCTVVGRLAASYLMGFGLSNFAFASFRLPMFWAQQRGRAFVDAVTAAGLGCSTFDPGRELKPVVRQRRLYEWLNALPHPCGVFAANDYVGEEIVGAAVQLGIRVPEELMVLGVDNDEQLCENLPVTLSSIAPEFEVGGYEAAKMLDELLSNPKMPPSFREYEATRIVVRKSTRRIVVDRSRVAAAVEMIRTHACVGIGVPDVVKIIGIPRRTAEMHFRESTGHSILEEIDEVRFQKVFELLRNPRQQLQAISDLCGFRTQNALRKAFLLRTGMSMREWRRQNH